MNLDLALPILLLISAVLLAACAGLWGADSRDRATERRDGRAIRWSLEPGDGLVERKQGR